VRKPSLVARPVGLLSDIHGNLPALEAVLDELARREVTDILAAGDHLLGGEQPLEVWRALSRVGARCTRGPSDEALGRVDPDALQPHDAHEETMAARFAETRRKIGDLVVEQLRRLPDKLRLPMIDGGELLLVHGSPFDPQVEMGHDLDDEELLTLLGGDPADVVVCGATHVPYDREVDGVRVVNVGSVGAAPEGRVGHFSILTPRMEGPLVEQAWVDY
jgi:predicted phosphodiesterase